MTTNGNGNGGGGASNGNVTGEDWSGKRIFTTGEAAQVCKVSQQTIIRCFDSGRLNGFRVPGSKFRRIPREELVRFMRDNQIPLDALEGEKRRILIVDDDPQIVRLFEDLLAGDGGYEVESAMTGYEAGLLTESFSPHLIVLDYMLPDINGNVVCERVRASERSDEVSILFISGVIERDEIERLMKAGADGFMRKPFDLDELLAEIERLVGREQAAG
ncbi:MAG: response regulator [Planctomycetota bacterium]